LRRVCKGKKRVEAMQFMVRYSYSNILL
jgi:hypothetical protein